MASDGRLQDVMLSGITKNGDTRGGILWCHPLQCKVDCKRLHFKDSGATLLLKIAIVIWLA